MSRKFNEIELDEADESDGGENGQSGTSGVEFHLDFLTGETRDDLLSPEDLKRLLKVHNDLHYDLVKKQKIERKTRLEIKEGKHPIISNDYTGDTGYGMSHSDVETHPINETAYFSGTIDKKVTFSPLDTQNIANDDKKKELVKRNELKNEHRLQHTHTPKFNPRPQRPG
jgi:hypothetical protein